MGCGGSKDEKPKPDLKRGDPKKEEAKNAVTTEAKKAEKSASPKSGAAAEKSEAPANKASTPSRLVAAEEDAPEQAATEPAAATTETAHGTLGPNNHPTTEAPSVPTVLIKDINERLDNSIPVEPTQKMEPYQVSSTAANKQAGKDPLMIADKPDGADGAATVRSPRRANSGTPRRLQRNSQGNTTHRAVAGDDERMCGPGPSSDFPTEVMYPCFDEGHLYRLVNKKRHMWGFYNDSTNYIMHVEAIFGHESDVRALGKTQQTIHDELTGHCTLTLDIEPLQTEPFMRGEFNGFAVAYDAEPLPYAKRQAYAAALNGPSAQ